MYPTKFHESFDTLKIDNIEVHSNAKHKSNLIVSD